MRSEIQSWIDDGKPFEIGQSLYDKYGDSVVLKNLFRTDSPFSRKKMEAELLRLLGQHREAVVRQLPVHSSYTVADLPPELQAEFKNKAKLFGQVAQLHNDLYHTRIAAKRKLIREKMMKLLDEMNAIWNRCDRYMAEKTAASAAPASPTLLIIERNNLRVKISRAKKKGDAELLTQLTESLTELNKQLDAAKAR
jgi:hypothetical protein